MKMIPSSAVEQALASIRRIVNTLDSNSSKYGVAMTGTATRNGDFLNAIQDLEKLIMFMRSEALACADITERAELEKELNEPLDVRVNVTPDNILFVKIPLVLPAKRRSTNVDLISAVLRTTLANTPNIPYSTEPQTFIVRHCYNAALPEQLIRDHDN